MAMSFSKRDGIEREAVVGEAICGIHEDRDLTIGYDIFPYFFCRQHKGKVFVVDVLFMK